MNRLCSSLRFCLQGLNNKVADVQLNDRAQSANDDTHSKRARVAHAANITPQQSVAGGIQPEPEAAASAAPVSGGFGGLASKGANGFAFGGGSTFSGGFGSVAFGGGGFGSSAPASAAGAAAPSFASKASKDGAASPSEASNAGSGAQPAFSAQAMGSDTATAPEAVAQVFGSTPGAHQCAFLIYSVFLPYPSFAAHKTYSRLSPMHPGICARFGLLWL